MKPWIYSIVRCFDQVKAVDGHRACTAYGRKEPVSTQYPDGVNGPGAHTAHILLRPGTTSHRWKFYPIMKLSEGAENMPVRSLSCPDMEQSCLPHPPIHLLAPAMVKAGMRLQISSHFPQNHRRYQEMERHVPVSQRIVMQLPMSPPASGHPFRDEVPAPTPRGVLFPRMVKQKPLSGPWMADLLMPGKTCQGYVFVAFYEENLFNGISQTLLSKLRQRIQLC